jgi:magnesium chelatase family protein
VPAVRFQELAEPNDGQESSQGMRKRVQAAREKQRARFSRSKIFANAHMTPRHLKEYCILTNETRRLLEAAMEKLALSARAYSRILKIARTIADLEGEQNLSPAHVAEAIQYRSLDRKFA